MIDWLNIEDVSPNHDGSALRVLLSKGDGWQKPLKMCVAPWSPILYTHVGRKPTRFAQYTIAWCMIAYAYRQPSGVLQVRVQS